ncbi:MAG: hypothetical protein H6839_04225 [Planctomycetes bacterium]|nr:hypothetical protein [Planctomycetota bacterium]
MSGRNGLILGLVIGVTVGLVAVLVTMHVLSEQTVTKQASAYDQGLKDGLEMAQDPGVGIDISGKVNTGLMDENRALARQIDAARTGLEALQGRDDLTPQAKDQVALIMEGLK